MLKINYVIALLIFLSIKTVIAQEKVFIPDANFRAFLNSQYPTCMDGTGDSLILEQASLITGYFDCTNQNIADISGIEYFIKITQLVCTNNQLTGLPDISSMASLYYLNCSYNQLTQLPDLTYNTALIILECYNNQLTSLPDLSANTQLEILYCSDNQLTNLPDLSFNSNLTVLGCYYNQLDSLPSLSANTALKFLHCTGNKLEYLPDLSIHLYLEHLQCDVNKLRSLPDLSSNSALTYLNCRSNQLTSLPDLSANTALETIKCYHNQLTSMPDLSSNINLRELNCSNNFLASLPDLSANNALTELRCTYNKLDFSDARRLRMLDTLSGLTSLIYAPQNSFGIGETINLCENDTLVLCIASQDSATSYQWFKENDAILDATDTLLVIQGVTQEDEGIYTCKSFGTALDSPPMKFGPGISEFVSKPFVVKLNKKAGFTGLDEEQCMMGEENAVLTGIPPGGVFNGAGITDTLFNAEQAGMGIHEITYVYTDSNDCVSTASHFVIVSICDDIDDFNATRNISLYPNPSDGVVYLSGLFNSAWISVIDVTGQEVYSGLMKNQSERIDLSHLKKGIYIVIINDVYFRKIIME